MNKSLQRLILVSQFIMLLALEMGNPFLPLFIANQTNISTDEAIWFNAMAFALPMIANMIMSPVWGKLADRYGYKPMLMRAAWALVISQLLMAFANTIGFILIIRFLQGGFAGFIAAMQTYTLSLCGWYEKTQQLTRLQTAKAIATSCAGLSGGLLLSLVSFHGLFLLTSLLCLATTLMMHYYLPVSHYKELSSTSNISSGTSFRAFFSVLALLIVLAQVAKFLPDPVFSLYVTQILHKKPWVIGLMYSLPAVAILLTSSWCGRQFDRCRGNSSLVKNYFRGYFLLAIALMIALLFIQTPLLLAVVRFSWGVVLAAVLPALFALISDNADNQGYWLGLANSCAKLGNLAGILLGGWIAGILSLNFIFLIVAGVYFLMLIVNQISASFVSPSPLILQSPG
ncbi:MFS transporter [Legionella hackeliae]|uniref:Multidrug resistance efflux pump n=1 Tax=Legionella hackeliae TaxID=449 RepID=A0A0A8UTD7_LEGHA|nr:MFS transporter [Legionella hackeliae]KTD12582.1 multidrug resistance efflux pump [Legionella hackeliae]CEK11998.1 Multidrug resistance efflux pump [Legionella hackeliae]STX48780.1 multidrug resistance efflux pump [Legionella hackeliae]